jgi:hypothetical protein
METKQSKRTKPEPEQQNNKTTKTLPGESGFFSGESAGFRPLFAPPAAFDADAGCLLLACALGFGCSSSTMPSASTSLAEPSPRLSLPFFPATFPAPFLPSFFASAPFPSDCFCFFVGVFLIRSPNDFSSEDDDDDAELDSLSLSLPLAALRFLLGLFIGLARGLEGFFFTAL